LNPVILIRAIIIEESIVMAAAVYGKISILISVLRTINEVSELRTKTLNKLEKIIFITYLINKSFVLLDVILGIINPSE